MANGRAAVAAVPDVNDLVKITLGEIDDPDQSHLASDVSSRVEDVVRDVKTGTVIGYLIAAPWFSGDLELPPQASECTLLWPTPRGLGMLPVAFLDQEATPGGLRVWRLRVTGPPRRKERRQFVRVPWSLPTRLEIPHDPASLGPQMRRLVDRFGLQADLAQLPTLIEGIAVNVSEGGLLCLSPKPVLPANLPLTVRFTIESACFEVGCSVVWSLARERDTANEPGLLTVESALVFLDPRRYGEVLRPLLFQAQLRGRRAALR